MEEKSLYLPVETVKRFMYDSLYQAGRSRRRCLYFG